MAEEWGIVRSTLWLVSLAACLAAPPVHAQLRDARPNDDIRNALKKICQIYDLVSTQLAEPVDAERAMYDGAVRGALAVLDPFSTFLDAQQFHALQQQQQGIQKGFGAILNVQSGSVTVLQSVPGSPFARAGLGPGDRIIRINGQAVAFMGLQELVEVLQAAKSGNVRLSVLQSGTVVPRDIELSPTELPSPTVDKKFLVTPDTGYLHVARIEESTPGEIKNAIEQWQGINLRGVILDLRDNPGGSLEHAIAVASLFLQPGQAVVSLQGRAVPAKTYAVDSPPLWSNLPLAVLINGRSASAAEIIAAALQEHDRAWVVGEPSFGKGVVEAVMLLSEGTALALTVARYFTPQGRSVQRPLPGTALADIVGGADKRFHSDNGRPLAQGGGVQPDQQAASWQLDPWAAYFGQSTAFVNFAQSYIDRHGKVTESFEVNDAVLGEFQSFLEGAGLPVPPQSWTRSLPYIQVRIKTEMFNLVFGASRGDEVEVRGDPQVASAVQGLEQARKLLQYMEQHKSKQIAVGNQGERFFSPSRSLRFIHGQAAAK
ncbi:MAG: PDZ domain-containing protein [Acidobacteria bacterium]|nr:PDZ domain-containing protein [Acidobacteriota bacterium]